MAHNAFEVKAYGTTSGDNGFAVIDDGGTQLFAVDYTEGNTTIAGTLAVASTSVFTGAVTLTGGVAGSPTFAGNVQVSGTFGVTGVTTLSNFLSVAASISTAALGTQYLNHDQLTLDFAGSVTSGTVAACRGIVTIAAGTTIGGGAFIFGVNARLVVNGTMNHADSRLGALFAKLDISAGTLTSGQLSVAWFDCGSTGTGDGGGQYNIIRVQNTTAAVPNSWIYCYGSASFAFDLNSGAFTPGILSTTGTAGATAAKGWIKIVVDGATRYIPLTDSVS